MTNLADHLDALISQEEAKIKLAKEQIAVYKRMKRINAGLRVDVE